MGTPRTSRRALKAAQAVPIISGTTMRRAPWTRWEITPQKKTNFARSSSTGDDAVSTVEGHGMDQAINDFAIHLHDLNRSPLTIVRYTDLLRRFCRFACTELHRDVVASSEVDKALVVLFIREGGIASAESSAATRNSRLAGLRSFFRFLVMEERLGRDPASGLQAATLPEKAPTFLTAAEFSRFCRPVEANASDFYLRRDLAILITLWNTGLRLAELLFLDLLVADFEAGRLPSRAVLRSDRPRRCRRTIVDLA